MLRVKDMHSWSPPDHCGLRLTQDAYFSLLTHIKQLLLVKFCNTTAGNGVSFWKHERMDERTNGRTEPDGQTDVEVEIVI